MLALDKKLFHIKSVVDQKNIHHLSRGFITNKWLTWYNYNNDELLFGAFECMIITNYFEVFDEHKEYIFENQKVMCGIIFMHELNLIKSHHR